MANKRTIPSNQVIIVHTFKPYSPLGNTPYPEGVNIMMKFKLSPEGWHLYLQLFSEVMEFCKHTLEIPEIGVSNFLKGKMLPLRGFYEQKFGSEKDLVLIAKELIQSSPSLCCSDSSGDWGWSDVFSPDADDYDLASKHERILERRYEALNN